MNCNPELDQDHKLIMQMKDCTVEVCFIKQHNSQIPATVKQALIDSYEQRVCVELENSTAK